MTVDSDPVTRGLSMRPSSLAPLCLFFSLACSDDSAGISSGGKAVDASGGGDASDGGGEAGGGGGSEGDGGSGSGTTDDTAGDDGTTSGDDGTTGGDDGSDVDFDGPGPVITSSRVTCQDNGGSIESFVLDVLVDDPQGDDTIDDRECAWRVMAAGMDTVTGSLDCFDGWCIASLNASSLDSSCADGDRLLWEVNIVDEDGNATGWTEVPWDGPAG